MVEDIQQLFGENPASERVQAYISSLAVLESNASPTPEVKSYPDAVYFNYFSLGLSLLFKPTQGYKPKTGLRRDELTDDQLVLDGIDIYNVPKPKEGSGSQSRAKGKQLYTAYPLDTISLSLQATPDKPRESHMTIKRETTGKDFVQSMGEPDRKGGGAGPSSGSIGIWCEWTKDGVLVEFGGDEARGPQAWERGKDAVWKVTTLFPPSEA